MMSKTDVLRDSLRVLPFGVLLAGLLSGCANSDGGPTAPTLTAERDDVRPGAPVGASTLPVSFDTLRPDIQDDPYNAYDFTATYDGSMLTLTLTEDEMRSMRQASKPHRNRMITVGICPSEPHHISQSCGDPIWQGSMRLAGSLALPAVPLAACNGWIVVNAAELYDDRYDGWRNAPCPRPDGGPVGSDGTGDVWPDYSEYDRKDPRANIPEPGPEPGAYTDTRPVWILLADSLTAARNLGRTGAGPDGGTWPLRWARYYYAPEDRTRMIVQAYSEGSWEHGGTEAVGCLVYRDALNFYLAKRSSGGGDLVEDGAALINNDIQVNRLDADRNPIPRVPSGYMDTAARLWTFSFPRSTYTRFHLRCNDRDNNVGQIYFFDVPLPPSTG